MADPVDTVVDRHSLVLRGGEFRDETFKAAGADTFPEGTILARDTSDDKLVPFDPDDAGAVGHEFVKAVLPSEVVTTGAGDTPIRALVAGVVKEQDLSIQDGATITPAMLDDLRGVGIVPIDTDELGA